jgi:hypothetical protein
VKKTPIRKASLAKTKWTAAANDQSQEEKPQYQWHRPKDRHGKRAKAAIEHGYFKSWSSLNHQLQEWPETTTPG